MSRATEHIASTRALLRGHRRGVLLAVALMLLTLTAGVGLLGLSGGFLTGAALTFGTLGAFNFFTPSAGIRGLTLARIVSRYLEKLLGHDTMLRIARDLRSWFFARALRLSPAQLGRLRTGDLLARLLDDIDAVDGLLLRAKPKTKKFEPVANNATISGIEILDESGAASWRTRSTTPSPTRPTHATTT